MKKKNENWLMRAYAREAKKLYVIGFYWSSFVLKNAANGRKKAANFDSIPPYFFDFLRGFLRVDCGEFASSGRGRFSVRTKCKTKARSVRNGFAQRKRAANELFSLTLLQSVIDNFC